MNKKDLEIKARAYALKNALSHDGTAAQGPVISSLFNEGLKKSEAGKYAKHISEIILEINSLSSEDQKKEFEKIKDLLSEREVREGLQELPDVKKSGVVMRIAPSPSGPFHIGHALTSSLSYLYVKKYGGKFYVRIEDTNPENIYESAYKMIADESEWLFDGIAQVVIQSDRIEIYYGYVDKLLAKNAVYVCTCSGDEFRDLAKAKKECPCRSLSFQENKTRWRNMILPEGYSNGEAVLRFKSSCGMTDPNPAMRDFPLARVNTSSHPRQGTKYKVWPLMNLAVTVDDIEMKMTHIIRGKDHRDNAKRQEMIYKVLGKKFPWIGFLGIWHFKDLELSSTKMREGIESGKYSGWDDVKLPTVASLRKQGYKPEAFWKFAEVIGLSENDKVIDKEEYFTMLSNFNK